MVRARAEPGFFFRPPPAHPFPAGADSRLSFRRTAVRIVITPFCYTLGIPPDITEMDRRAVHDLSLSNSPARGRALLRTVRRPFGARHAPDSLFRPRLSRKSKAPILILSQRWDTNGQTRISPARPLRGSAEWSSFACFSLPKNKAPHFFCHIPTTRDTGGQTDRFVRLFRCAGERAGWVFFCLLFFSQKRKVDQWVRRLRPRERRRARTFLPLAVAILLRKPCTLLRWRFFG